MAMPSDFLINKEGKIAWHLIIDNIPRPEMDLILKVIDENIE